MVSVKYKPERKNAYKLERKWKNKNWPRKDQTKRNKIKLKSKAKEAGNDEN